MNVPFTISLSKVEESTIIGQVKGIAIIDNDTERRKRKRSEVS